MVNVLPFGNVKIFNYSFRPVLRQIDTLEENQIIEHSLST